MPILKSLPIKYTFKRPFLDLNHIPPQPQPSQLPIDRVEHGYATHQPLELEEMVNFGDYPPELFQLRVKSIQEHVSTCFPPTYLYIASLVSILVIFVALLATALALHVSDGKPWVLGVIVILILIFISKMSFLSRIEKAHKEIIELMQTFNDQDMSNYGVLYRVRLSDHQTSKMHSSRLIRFVYRLNLGLPHYTVDLTTINHIDEYSFQDHPASDPYASSEQVLARENELPKYRPKVEAEGETNDIIQPQREFVLGEAHPPKYDDLVIEINVPTSSHSGNDNHHAMDEVATSSGPSQDTTSSLSSS
ncbi:hypothetical protein BGZ49_004274 [Haplosporangium sp. Z 27]|nr:hypothetical protein BGZ49_004274 [Haplosporangium sp. Z 27]